MLLKERLKTTLNCVARKRLVDTILKKLIIMLHVKTMIEKGSHNTVVFLTSPTFKLNKNNEFHIS